MPPVRTRKQGLCQTYPIGESEALARAFGALSGWTARGGVFGDPYEGMTQVGERSLKVGNYGGSSWRWSSSYTLAWRDGAMAVVGYDSSSFHTSRPEDVEEVSVNLLNGRATKNGAVKRHDQGKVAADDCDAVQKLGSIELK